MSCLMEDRQERPGVEVKNYYYPLASREAVPNAWKFYDVHQCRPFHGPGGPVAYAPMDFNWLHKAQGQSRSFASSPRPHDFSSPTPNGAKANGVANGHR